jgi:chaperone modulatory protein CbpM
MMRIQAIIARFPDLEIVELTGWIEQGWVTPMAVVEDRVEDWQFEGIDIARVGLIYDLRRNLGVEIDAMPLVLSLLDQLYDLRATLKSVSSALDGQPPEVRKAVLAAMANAAVP